MVHITQMGNQFAKKKGINVNFISVEGVFVASQRSMNIQAVLILLAT